MTTKTPHQTLLQIARESIQHFLKGKPYNPPPTEAGDFNGIFVTLWTLTPQGHELRGCIGRHQRRFQTIGEEVAECAVLSATEDPRFPAVRLEELSHIGIEISLLGKPQPVKSPQELDPHRYGVIVSSGFKGATLLPDIEGIDTVDQQLQAVKHKAGIGGRDEIVIQRFSVEKVC